MSAAAWYAIWTRSRHEQVVREQIERLEEACAAVGRDPATVTPEALVSTVVVGFIKREFFFDLLFFWMAGYCMSAWMTLNAAASSTRCGHMPNRPRE